MDFLRRLLGFDEPDDNPDGRNPAGDIERTPRPLGAQPPPALSQAPAAHACPSCAALLDPPPVRNRLCPQCRQPIVVRRVGGRLALLTEAAVGVFEAERERENNQRAWAAARQRWLRLAKNVKAPPTRRQKLAVAPLTAEVVRSSRTLYLATAERAAKAARHEKRWGDVGRILREQAAALYEEAGSPVPPPGEIAQIHREGMTAVLRSLEPLAKEVELVSTGCCPVCRADEDETFRITLEMRTARLPHAGCPRGLCGCDWWPAVVQPRKRRRRAPAARGPSGTSAAVPLNPGPDDLGPDA
jgi:hypothetical protein